MASYIFTATPFYSMELGSELCGGHSVLQRKFWSDFHCSTALALRHGAPSSYEKHWTFLLPIKIAHDLRVCHGIYPGSVVRVQGHCSKTMHIFCLGHMENDKNLKIACDL